MDEGFVAGHMTVHVGDGGFRPSWTGTVDGKGRLQIANRSDATVGVYGSPEQIRELLLQALGCLPASADEPAEVAS